MGTAVTQIQTLKTMLESGKGQLQLAMQKHMDPDRMIRLALTAASKSPQLAACTPQSVGLALLTASQLGLEPNGRDAHLVPYGKECQLIPDYKGLVKLAFACPRVKQFYAKEVYENDEFEVEFGTSPRIHHSPAMGKRGKLIAAYAVAQIDTAEPQFDVMFEEDILKRKAVSQSARSASSPWNKWPEEMWKKTVAKRLCKWIPAGRELEAAVEHDNQVETIDVAFTEPQSSSVDQLSADFQDSGEAATPEQIEYFEQLEIELEPLVLKATDGRTDDLRALTKVEADALRKLVG